ncbi:hypothetical protein BC834DRAFT_841284 [Gloeopeniophorella convolvens]|nr:hypothetical protein BC834DRAFT_841284 [Gloeopeniophorella convolvens]
MCEPGGVLDSQTTDTQSFGDGQFTQSDLSQERRAALAKIDEEYTVDARCSDLLGLEEDWGEVEMQVQEGHRDKRIAPCKTCEARIEADDEIHMQLLEAQFEVHELQGKLEAAERTIIREQKTAGFYRLQWMLSDEYQANLQGTQRGATPHAKAMKASN